MTNPASLSLQDLEYAYFKAAYTGTSTDIGTVALGQGIKTSSPAPGNFASVVGSGTTAAAPTGGTSIVICAVPTTGMYLVSAVGGFAGTAESTQLDNIAVKKNSTFITNLPIENLANTLSPRLDFYVNATAGDNITLYVFNNGSAGSLYKGTLCITRVV